MAASVGVEARTSATRSSSGWSGSWPIAETTGVRHFGDGADQRLVGERQQVLDRAAAAGDDDHVDVARRGRAGRAPSITSAAARVPCMAAYAVSKATAGQRRRAFSTHVALGGGVRAP